MTDGREQDRGRHWVCLEDRRRDPELEARRSREFLEPLPIAAPGSDAERADAGDRDEPSGTSRRDFAKLLGFSLAAAGCSRAPVKEAVPFVELPEGVTPTLGPDATGVGWVYEYALVDRTGQRDLADLRSIQDWYLRYPLQTVPGVAEVASVGGYVKQYQVEVDPNALAAYGTALGLAFQIAGDILDVTGDAAVLGKTAGRDRVLEKATFPALAGLDGARERAEAEVERALVALETGGIRSDELTGLARFAVARDR